MYRSRSYIIINLVVDNLFYNLIIIIIDIYVIYFNLFISVLLVIIMFQIIYYAYIVFQ